MLNNIEAEKSRFGMTRKSLSQKIGITPNTLRWWMNGEQEIPSSALIKMANMWDCSVDYLLGRTDQRKSAS